MSERSGKPPAQSHGKPGQSAKARADELLDEALKETFPASDPPSITQPAPDGESKPPADHNTDDD
jgi:hypothetical protein